MKCTLIITNYSLPYTLSILLSTQLVTMSHENSKAMAGSLPEEPGMPTTFHQTQYHPDVEPVSGNVFLRPQH